MKSIAMYYSQFDFQSFVRRRGVMTMMGIMVFAAIVLFHWILL